MIFILILVLMQRGKETCEETVLLTGCKSVEEAGAALIEKGAAVALVTCGGDGAYICTREGGIQIPAEGGKLVDTTGAGDAFMGGFLYQLAKAEKKPATLSLAEVAEFARFAAKVAGVCISRRGAINAMPTMEEL